MDIKSRKALSKALAALVFSSALTGAALNVSAAAYDGDAADGVSKNENEDLGTTVKSILGVASGYNVFLSGNYNQTAMNNVDAGDGRGVLAVGGNYDVGYFNNQKCASATVAGSVTGTIDGQYIQGGIDFDSAFDSLRQLSSTLASAQGTTVADSTDTNYIRNNYGTITFKGTNSDVNVFNITVDELNELKGGAAASMESASHALSFDVPDGSTVIVNITGTGAIDLTFNWGAFYSTTGQLTSSNKYGNSKVLINVPNGNTVAIAGGVGSLLAPESDIVSGKYSGVNAHYEGQVIGKSFTGNIEFGSSTFDGEDESVIAIVKGTTPTDETEEDTDKPEETEETTAAEETTAPEEKEPEDTTSGETTTAEETAAPEETTTDSTLADPDGGFAPTGTTAAQTTTAEETTTPEETTAPEIPEDTTETSADVTTYQEISVPVSTEIPFLVTTSENATVIEDGEPIIEETTGETEDTTPTETPADSGDTTPDETPADSGDTTPDETPADSGDTTPDETPADSGDTTPDETPADSGDTTPDETPADSGDTTPDETPTDTGDSTPTDTPAEVDDSNPSNIPDGGSSPAPTDTPTYGGGRTIYVVTTHEEEEEPEETTVGETAKPEDTTVGETAKPEDTTVGEIAKPEDTTVGETAKPEDTTVGETAKPEETTVGETAKPEETTVGETAKPEDTTVGETVKPEDTTVGETAKPEETTVGETAKPEETTVGETAKPEDTTVGETAKPEETTVGETAKPETTPAETTTPSAPITDAGIKTTPKIYREITVPSDTPVDFIVTTTGAAPTVTEETTTSAPKETTIVPVDAPELVVEDSDGDTTVPEEYYNFDENKTPLGEFYDFDENKTPLGAFDETDSANKNPDTGVASPAAMGAAAIASMALAIKARKKRK